MAPSAVTCSVTPEVQPRHTVGVVGVGRLVGLVAVLAGRRDALDGVRHPLVDLHQLLDGRLVLLDALG